MKLDQAQAKKIGLTLAVLAALLYGYFSFLLGPLQHQEQMARNGIADLGPQIDDAKQQIAKTAELEKQAPAATAFLENLKNSIPDGAPIAWFPPKIADFFHSHGIDKITTRLQSESDDSLPGFKKITWTIDIPKVEFVPLGEAIASLENDEPLTAVLNISVDAIREDAQYQHATLIIETLVKS
ncbi:MAG: hypothetical protein ABSE62_09370 [Chthoniobacteraceae bacterium]|jgi:hypothetical protein